MPYNTGLYSPEMDQRTYEEVCRRAGDLLDAGLPVVIDGAFKTRAERRLVIDMAQDHEADLRFVQTVCAEDAQRERLGARQEYDTFSDGRIELMERQGAEFEPPADDAAHLFERFSTDGPEKETQARMVAHLRELGMLEPPR